jgi:glycerol-3-phosphate acyltransferase PlsY
MKETFLILAAYLVGAIPFALIVSRLAGVGDIRKLGSGNPGATNVWRVAGFKVAVWVFIGDIGKGALVVLAARDLTGRLALSAVSGDLLLVACAAAVIIGHIFPVYLYFRGGKGVNTALGAITALLPVETLISLGVFVIVVLVFRYVSLGSILGAASFCVVIMTEKFVLDGRLAMVYVYLSVFVPAVIILSHRQNISRLIRGTEPRFSLSSRTESGGSHA